VTDDDRIELGLELLAHLEHGELSVKEAMDRIEIVTTSPQLQRDILEERLRAAASSSARTGLSVRSRTERT